MGVCIMKDEMLLPEEEMQIEIEARKAYLFASEYGSNGVDHFLKTLSGLIDRMNAFNSSGHGQKRIIDNS